MRDSADMREYLMVATLIVWTLVALAVVAALIGWVPSGALLRGPVSPGTASSVSGDPSP